MTPDDKKRIEDLRRNGCSCAEDEQFLFAKLDEAHEALGKAVWRLNEYKNGNCLFPAWAEFTLDEIKAILNGKKALGEE
jgi:hypothetical protein